MNKRRNVIFSVLLLLILAIAGFFIVDQLGRSQTAEDAAAGSCDNGEFCGGCINSCVPWSEFPASGGCNALIDQRCGGNDQQCAGNGAFPGAAGCCPGLNQCSNGRFA
jgi:hypothetical protein